MPSYILTADALLNFLSDDPEWCRLSDEFHSLSREDEPQKKHQVLDELKTCENELFDNVYQAVVGQKLQVLVSINETSTIQLPGTYLLTDKIADALRSGWVETLRLVGRDTAWNGARLVFTEEKWQLWLKSYSKSSVEAEVNKSAAIREFERPFQGGPPPMDDSGTVCPSSGCSERVVRRVDSAIDDRKTLAAMLTAYDMQPESFSVNKYVLQHQGAIPGHSLDAKIRRLQRKFASSLDLRPKIRGAE